MENQDSIGNQFLLKVHQGIDDNLDNENFSVEELAQNVGLSRSMLHRKLIKLIGKSASDLITEKRLNRAKELLEKDTATVSEIAYRVGFNSPSYFNKVFKTHYKVSPGNVRKGVIIKGDGLSKDQKRFIPWKVIIIIFIVLTIGGGLFYASKIVTTPERSIAVLPFNNLTGQAENAYFIDGMHDALIGELGRIVSLRVISRTSTLRYRESDMLLKDIAQELGVNTIVEGSILGAGDSLRILIQLIDVYPKERHLLANEYHDKMQNVLTVQNSAVQDIAKKIKLKLSKTEEQRFKKNRTVNQESYKDYFRGMYYMNQGTNESFEKGIKFLLGAIERDPGDPFAYGGLALGYATMGHGQLDSKEAFNRATVAAKKAIKLDPSLDEAYTALASLYLYDTRDWTVTKKAFENALANNPNNEYAHAHFAWYHVLFDDMEKTLYHAHKAAVLEPFSPAYKSWLAALYFYYKEYDKAGYWAGKAIELKENNPYGNYVMALVNLQKKKYKLAVEYIENLPEKGVYWKTIRGYVYVRANKREKALAYWDEIEEYSKTHWTNPCHRGMMAAYLGFTDKAFELLNTAVENNTYPIAYLQTYPFTEDIENDPRFQALYQKMNLPYKRTIISSNQ